MRPSRSAFLTATAVLAAILASLAAVQECSSAELKNSTNLISQFVHVFGADSSSAKTGRMLLRETPLRTDDSINPSFTPVGIDGTGIVTAGIFNGRLKLDAAHSVDTGSHASIFIARFDATKVITSSVSHFKTSPVHSLYASSANQNKVFSWVATITAGEGAAIKLQSMTRFIHPSTNTPAVAVAGTFSSNITYAVQDASSDTKTIAVDSAEDGLPALFVAAFEIATGRLLFHQTGSYVQESTTTLSIAPSALTACGSNENEICHKFLLLTATFASKLRYGSCQFNSSYENDKNNSVVLALDSLNGVLPDCASSGLRLLPELAEDWVRVENAAAFDENALKESDNDHAYFFTVGQLQGNLSTFNIGGLSASSPKLFVLKFVSKMSNPLLPEAGHVLPVDNASGLQVQPLSSTALLISGHFNGDIQCGDKTISSKDNQDAFIGKVDLTTGAFEWVWVLGGDKSDVFTRPTVTSDLSSVAVVAHSYETSTLSGILDSELAPPLVDTNRTGVIILVFSMDGQPIYHHFSADSTGETVVEDVVFYRKNNLIFTGMASNEINFQNYHMKSSFDVAYLSGILVCNANCNLQDRSPCLSGGDGTCDVCQSGYEPNAEGTCIAAYNEELDLFSGSFFKVTLGIFMTTSILCLIYFIWKSKMAKAAGNVAKAAAEKIAHKGRSHGKSYRRLNNRDEFEMLSKDGGLDDEDEVVFDVSTRS